MAVENIEVIRRWFEEGWNEGREDVFDELFAEDGVAHGLGEAGVDVRGAEGFKPFFRKLRGAFPDIRVVIEDYVSAGEKIATRFSATMTHEGDDLGVPATGRRVAVTGMVFNVIRDGRIAEAWNEWDIAAMTEQICAEAAPRAAGVRILE